ncbi:MAG: hypothetical protein GW783_02505 [Deltaproteobacteria bacterium]|nr:hypothetical protein [Deltaproteobacteria bacterium]NCP96658.1 hypothetical protein [Deltaproteobacteria bacterium]NCS72987.1 hypothetical protein [Deltaproteobacteria bacterium]
MRPFPFLLLLLATGCGISSSSQDGSLTSEAGEVLAREVTGSGEIAGSYAVTLESTLRLRSTGSFIDRLKVNTELACFFSPGCSTTVGRIAKVESAAELLDPHCDEWEATQENNTTTVVCRQKGRRAQVRVADGEVAIALATEGADTVTSFAPVPPVGSPVVVDDLVAELGGPLELYFTPAGVVAAREATADSGLVGDVLRVMDDAGLDVEVVLDFTLRGGRDGAPPPEVTNVLKYFTHALQEQ